MMTVISALPVAGPAPVPPGWAKAAAAKLKRDRQSYTEFRAADQQEHERARMERLAAAVADAEDDLRAWQENVNVLEPEAAEALAAFRAAEDRDREAREYARQQRAAYERVKGKVPAEEETGALIRADTADQVAADAAEVLEQKRAELADADQNLAETREGLAGAEQALDKARKAAEVPPGVAPISDVTVRACAHYVQADEVWEQLPDRDRFRVRQAAEPRNMMSDQQFQLMLREVFGYGGNTA